MSDIVMKQESTLTNKTTPTMTDLLRLVGSDDHSYKALVSDVAKAIIETYAGSTLAGSAQSVKSALDALNSKTKVLSASETDLNNYTSSGIWSFDELSSSMSHIPNTGQYFSGTLFVEYYSNAKILQVLISSSAKVFTRYRWNSSTTWGDWVSQPTRAEMDNAYMSHAIGSVTDCDNFTTTGTYYGTFTANYPSDAASSGYLFVYPHPTTANYVKQLYSSYSSNSLYLRTRNNGSWTGWILLPTRAEIDALNSKYVLIPVSTNITTVSEVITTLNGYDQSKIPVGSVIATIARNSAARCTIIINKLSDSYGAGLLISYYSGINGKKLKFDNATWSEIT